MFSPGEEYIQLDEYLDEKEKEYIDHFDGIRDDTFETLEENYNLQVVKEAMGILNSLEWRKYTERIASLLQPVSNGYLDYFVDVVEQKIDSAAQGSLETVANLPGVDKM
jgi:hypothetical protein